MNVMQFISTYWWVLALVAAAIFYKAILRLFGIIIIPENRIGLVTKNFVIFGSGRTLPDGKIIALNGEAGLQADTLAPGLHFWYWPWQFKIDRVPFTIVQEGKIGLVHAKDGAAIPAGSILGTRVQCDSFQNAAAFLRAGGQKGRQASVITAGSYRINTHLFHIEEVPMTHVESNTVGIVTSLDGEPLPEGDIAGKIIEGHNNFQNFDTFLALGGNKGMQPQVIMAGNYNINPWAVKINGVSMTEIPIGNVGVVISYIGEKGKDVSGDEFKHGNLVEKGYKGVWSETLEPGHYPINPNTHKVEIVPTTNIVLNWANARTEAHSLDQHLSTIRVRSKDGFEFNVDVNQIIHISPKHAPMVIARFGSMHNLVSQVLEPTIGNYFRNSAQTSEVLEFLSMRTTRQEEAKTHINKVLLQYNVEGVDTLIGDIVPPASIMNTLSERKLAFEQKETFAAQKNAQISRQEFEREKTIAECQTSKEQSNIAVHIAERNADAGIKAATGAAESQIIAAAAEAKSIRLRAAAQAEQTRLTGTAEAEKILAIGKSNAEAYKLQVEAMGAQNFAMLKTTEAIGANKIKVMPELLIMGGKEGGGNSLDGLLGLKLLEGMGTAVKTMPSSEPGS